MSAVLHQCMVRNCSGKRLAEGQQNVLCTAWCIGKIIYDNSIGCFIMFGELAIYLLRFTAIC